MGLRLLFGSYLLSNIPIGLTFCSMHLTGYIIFSFEVEMSHNARFKLLNYFWCFQSSLVHLSCYSLYTYSVLVLTTVV